MTKAAKLTVDIGSELHAMRQELREMRDAFTDWRLSVEVRLTEGSANFEAHDSALSHITDQYDILSSHVENLRLADRRALATATAVGTAVGSLAGILVVYVISRLT